MVSGVPQLFLKEPDTQNLWRCERKEIPSLGAFLSWARNLEAKLQCFMSTLGHGPGRMVVWVIYAENSSCPATAFPVAWRLWPVPNWITEAASDRWQTPAVAGGLVCWARFLWALESHHASLPWSVFSDVTECEPVARNPPRWAEWASDTDQPLFYSLPLRTGG